MTLKVVQGLIVCVLNSDGENGSERDVAFSCTLKCILTNHVAGRWGYGDTLTITCQIQKRTDRRGLPNVGISPWLTAPPALVTLTLTVKDNAKISRQKWSDKHLVLSLRKADFFISTDSENLLKKTAI